MLLVLHQDENQTAAGAIKLLLFTGARRNEITHAKWEYLNWDQATLLVPRSQSGRSRLIRLNSSALDVLRATATSEGNPYIFPSPLTGRPCPSLHFPWSRIRRKSGLRDVRLHDLRQSFASFLVNEGVSLYVVQGLLGHTQVRATSDMRILRMKLSLGQRSLSEGWLPRASRRATHLARLFPPLRR